MPEGIDTQAVGRMLVRLFDDLGFVLICDSGVDITMLSNIADQSHVIAWLRSQADAIEAGSYDSRTMHTVSDA